MNRDQHGLWISTTADSKGELLVSREADIRIPCRGKPAFEDMGVSLLPGPMVKDLRRGHRPPIHERSQDVLGRETNLVIDDLEPTRLDHEDFTDIGLSHIGPAFLFFHRLEEFLEGNKPIRVWHQAKFVRAATQNVTEKLCESIGLTSCHEIRTVQILRAAPGGAQNDMVCHSGGARQDLSLRRESE
jgi:hypothetical protein